MLTEIRYGIDIGLTAVTVSPFPIRDYSYLFGDIRISYSQELVSIRLPSLGLGQRLVVVEGLSSNAVFNMTAGNTCEYTLGIVVMSDGDGTVTAPFTFSSNCEFTLTKISSDANSDTASGWASLSGLARVSILMVGVVVAGAIAGGVFYFSKRVSRNKDDDDYAKEPLMS